MITRRPARLTVPRGLIPSVTHPLRLVPSSPREPVPFPRSNYNIHCTVILRARCTSHFQGRSGSPTRASRSTSSTTPRSASSTCHTWTTVSSSTAQTTPTGSPRPWPRSTRCSSPWSGTTSPGGSPAHLPFGLSLFPIRSLSLPPLRSLSLPFPFASLPNMYQKETPKQFGA